MRQLDLPHAIHIDGHHEQIGEGLRETRPGGADTDHVPRPRVEPRGRGVPAAVRQPPRDGTARRDTRPGGRHGVRRRRRRGGGDAADGPDAGGPASVVRVRSDTLDRISPRGHGTDVPGGPPVRAGHEDPSPRRPRRVGGEHRGGLRLRGEIRMGGPRRGVGDQRGECARERDAGVEGLDDGGRMEGCVPAREGGDGGVVGESSIDETARCRCVVRE